MESARDTEELPDWDAYKPKGTVGSGEWFWVAAVGVLLLLVLAGLGLAAVCIRLGIPPPPLLPIPAVEVDQVAVVSAAEEAKQTWQRFTHAPWGQVIVVVAAVVTALATVGQWREARAARLAANSSANNRPASLTGRAGD